jgi:hypothetical protein
MWVYQWIFDDMAAVAWILRQRCRKQLQQTSLAIGVAASVVSILARPVMKSATTAHRK